ncbi:endo-alpha-N-acetylgalactosaminidase family protein [Paenibacillus sp. CF384]|uniref:endo-alpha-N-acetylgalactosaminidase family protein n=1 Tax=Paenibacillus sp. CF384 TaxID=1884382 RepID=UPI0008946B7C|nr:endo-alpha-N-acetylgalactosaminidase family protein [Paenibacillus sp. CF384]SDX97742.1 endo-alpha-N-acetylgalactosaminidase [Paenibacillus sp. CF384]
MKIVEANGSDTVVLLEDSPILGDGELAFTLTPLNAAGKVGAVIRYTATDSWIFIGCDTPMDPFGRSTWIWAAPCGKQGVLFKTDPLYEGKSYRMEIRFVGTVLTLSLDGYPEYHGDIPDLQTEAGAIGFRAWGDGEGEEGHARLDEVNATVLDDKYRSDSVDDIDVAAPSWKLESDLLEVELDTSFPRVLQYRWKTNGAELFGQEDRLIYVDLNGERYIPAVYLESKSQSVASYQLVFASIEVEMTVNFYISGATLEMNITNIQENGQFRIRTIAFPDHGLVSVRDTQECAHVASSEGIKGDDFAGASEWCVSGAPAYRAVAIVNTNQLAASVIGNMLHNRRRLCVQTVQRNGYKRTAVWNAYWTYRGPDMEVIGEPWSKVVLTDDRNGDGIVDWQDGAIATRELLGPIPGSESLRNSYAHIVMNFSSMAQFPFLRVLDNIKKFYLYTDGFGQLIELKGYQSEGHDSGHPDYGNNFNERAGGAQDLNVLAERALDFGVVIGVHINHSEAYPEARSYSSSLVTSTPGWKWLDQSYYIDREQDIRSGDFDRRLDELNEHAPHLGFVYVDTYRDEHWAAWRLVKKLRGNGWTIWTEEADALDSDAVWTHDSTGNSRISRFIRHTDKDVYAEDILLKGGYARYGDNGFMGWQRERDLKAVIRSFFTKQLPYRYLMHFAIMNWKDSEEVILEGGVSSRLEEGVAVIRRSDRVIAVGDTVFIPWDPIGETKIYHWNAAGGETVWQLPDSWPVDGVVKLYRLTNLGREFVRDVRVVSGSVVVAAEACTPYVLYKSEAPPVPKMAWSEGSPVKDMGFDSHGFDWWSKSSQSGNTDHIAIAETSYGQSYLRISGNNGADGRVYQTLSGLIPGKSYSASVWVEVSEGRKAAIRIDGYGGEELTRTISRTAVVNCDVDSDKRGTYYQRLQLRFEMPHSEDERVPVLSLLAEQGEPNSFVHFDDVRVREVGSLTQTEHYFYEDFEQVDEGWGPFVSANPKIGKTHLAQLHEGYTEDTLAGEWSLKTMDELSGELLRTLPSRLEFKPNRSYKLTFDYRSEHEAQYSICVRTAYGGLLREVFTEPLQKGLNRFTAELVTGPYPDYYVAIVRNDVNKGSLVIDNVIVDELTE